MDQNQQERYSRQIRFAPIGVGGQEKLLQSHVAIVGCGALGTVQASILARAGVGRLTIIDRDYVEVSNLQRQWLFEESDAEQGLPKAVAAAKAIARVNSTITVDAMVSDLTPTNIDDLLQGAHILLDALDNWETRYLLNEYAVSRGIPWIYGAAVGSYGIAMPIQPGRSACLQCVYPERPSGDQPTCETDGVLGSATAAIGAIQAGDAIKILVHGSVRERITTLDVWEGTVRQITQPPRQPECKACGATPDLQYLRGQHRPPVSLCGRNAVQIHERTRPIQMKELRERLERLAPVRANEFAIRFFPSPFELTIFPDGRAIIKGTTDVGVARSLYSKYVGS
jgi:adenylyltransferase/sulfurtransferase